MGQECPVECFMIMDAEIGTIPKECSRHGGGYFNEGLKKDNGAD